jgi:hypothetical protein
VIRMAGVGERRGELRRQQGPRRPLGGGAAGQRRPAGGRAHVRRPNVEKRAWQGPRPPLGGGALAPLTQNIRSEDQVKIGF